jgi:hypothetical protein
MFSIIEIIQKTKLKKIEGNKKEEKGIIGNLEYSSIT